MKISSLGHIDKIAHEISEMSATSEEVAATTFHVTRTSKELSKEITSIANKFRNHL